MRPAGLVEDRYLARESGSIHLLRGGSGPPLLFLHAWVGSGRWLPIHERLAQHFSVLAPDHPGFGLSDQPEEIEGVDDLVYHYLDVLDELELAEAAVVGASLGGWVAAELAAHSPQRVSKLVLLAPLGLRLPDHPVTDIFLMTEQQRAQALYADPASAGVPGTDPEAAFRTYKDLTALARYAWAPFMCNPKLERRLHRVQSPTCVIAAGDDRVLPRAHCERYAERIPGACLRVVPDCGHALHLERSEEVADAVMGFLQGEPPSCTSRDRATA